MTGYLTGADQTIPNWLIKITFLGKVETTVRLSIKSRFGIMGFSTSDSILGPRFFSLTIPPFDQSFQPERCDQNLRHECHSQLRFSQLC